eukprot:gnl/Chilomastix_caulleri/642.p1 GENE.gnl/Chilomastix_caulleri/642~~gnl/Chilomastix_caulleri/642.p1  ORF type:complete len:202 (-),score=66.08 gnl/Chilomastix_caulleri/642:103-708(-)
MGLFKKKQTLEDQIFDMRFTARQFEKMARTAETERKKAEKQVADAIRAGYRDRAQIYAQTAIRQKAEHLQFLKLASRVDAVVSQLQTACAMDQMTHNMKNLTINLDKALKAMDVEQVSKIMSKFEEQFEELDVRGEFVNGTMNQQAIGATPQDQVDGLIAQIADENQIEMADKMGVAPTGAPAMGAKSKEEDDIMKRFNAL